MQQNSVKNVYFNLTIYSTAKLCKKVHNERLKIFKIPQTPTLCSIGVNLAGVMQVRRPSLFCWPDELLFFFLTKWAFTFFSFFVDQISFFQPCWCYAGLLPLPTVKELNRTSRSLGGIEDLQIIIIYQLWK